MAETTQPDNKQQRSHWADFMRDARARPLPLPLLQLLLLLLLLPATTATATATTTTTTTTPAATSTPAPTPTPTSSRPLQLKMHYNHNRNHNQHKLQLRHAFFIKTHRVPCAVVQNRPTISQIRHLNEFILFFCCFRQACICFTHAVTHPTIDEAAWCEPTLLLYLPPPTAGRRTVIL